MDSGAEELPAILGLSEDTWVPGASIADDKVTRLRVNLCYLHLITVSRVLIPTDQSPLCAPSIQAAEKKATARITPSLLSLLKHLLYPLNSVSRVHSASHILSHLHLAPSTYSERKWLQEVRAPCDDIQ